MKQAHIPFLGIVVLSIILLYTLIAVLS